MSPAGGVQRCVDSRYIEREVCNKISSPTFDICQTRRSSYAPNILSLAPSCTQVANSILIYRPLLVENKKRGVDEGRWSWVGCGYSTHIVGRRVLTQLLSLDLTSHPLFLPPPRKYPCSHLPKDYCQISPHTMAAARMSNRRRGK